MTPEELEAWMSEFERFLTGRSRRVELSRVLSTVLFTDIVSSTATTIAKGDHGWRELLDRHDDVIRDRVGRYGGRLIKNTGDGVPATFDSPARAVRCAQMLRAPIRELGIDVRSGLHTGEIELRDDDIAGAAVNLARRVCDSAQAGEVRVSESVLLVVAGSGLAFDDLGPHELKGIPGTWRLYRALD